MATTVARLQAVLDADTSRFDRAMGRSESKTQRFGRVAKAALVGGAAAGLYVLGKAAKIGWDEFNQGQKVAAQTNAVIKSTGGVANVSAQDVEALGKALMLKSGIDDEVIKSGENMLLTFRNIRNEAGRNNDIFDQATKLTLDLSVAMGKDMSDSAILVGKALNDPIRGLTALRRVGVSFNDSQEKTIKKLVETGKTAEAQKLILEELRKEFGGSAKAAGETFGGQLNILRERLNNFLGDLTEKAIPYLQRFAHWIDPKITAAVKTIRAAMAEWQKRINEVSAVLAEHQSEVRKVVFVLGILWKVVSTAIKIQLFWAKVIGKIWVTEIRIALAAIQGLTAAVRFLGKTAQTVGAAIARAFHAVAPAIRIALAPLFTLISLMERAYSVAQRLLGILSSVRSENAGVPTGRGGSGARAGGGPVMAGREYVVGERGAEIFRPRVSGTIIPNHHLAGAGTVTVNLYGTLIDERAGEKVVRMLEEWQRRGGR